MSDGNFELKFETGLFDTVFANVDEANVEFQVDKDGFRVVVRTGDDGGLHDACVELKVDHYVSNGEDGLLHLRVYADTIPNDTALIFDTILSERKGYYEKRDEAYMTAEEIYNEVCDWRMPESISALSHELLTEKLGAFALKSVKAVEGHGKPILHLGFYQPPAPADVAKLTALLKPDLIEDAGTLDLIFHWRS